MMPNKRKLKVAFVGGGSLAWGPQLIRDIIFKQGMAQVELEFSLCDLNLARARAIKRLFDIHLEAWGLSRVRLRATNDQQKAIRGADFVLIAISTGGLAAMRHDLVIPERYGIYHTVGDTAGPGGWSRALRNIPVFASYAEQIKELAPNAVVLNYTNPLAALTKVLSDKLGAGRVVGLCHGLFECYSVLQELFGLKGEREIKLHFGGLNHFFWILDFTVRGEDGYALLRRKMRGRPLYEVLEAIRPEAGGWARGNRVATELFENYGYLPYTADRHICEFFSCYMANPEVIERFKVERTSVDQRASWYARLEQQLKKQIRERKGLSKNPSRETAADIIAAVVFDRGFTDVVNTVNVGQIANLPQGATVETMGYVDAAGVKSFTLGPLPEPLRALCAPHAEAQVKTVEAGLSGDVDLALMALVADPACSHMTVADIKKMGMELLRANKHHLPQFLG